MLLKNTKTDIADIAHTGLQFLGWSTILKQVKNPQSPCRCEIKIEPVQEGQNAPFSHYLFIYYYYYYFFLGGGGSKLFIMIAALKKNGMEQPPPHPPENKNDLRKSYFNAPTWTPKSK